MQQPAMILRESLAVLRAQARNGTPVWDLGVRLFHWLLVASVTIAALTGFFAQRSALQLHLIAGGIIAALIGFRIVWGLLGGGYARFASFAFSPPSVLAYGRQMIAGRTARYLGHNPLGGLMVFALLAVLTLIVLTGTVTLGGLVKQGPLAFATSFAGGAQAIGLHKLLSLLLVAMIAAHLWGVWFESRREGENLVVAMVTGAKSHIEANPPRWKAHRRLATLICIALGAAGTFGITALANLPGLGVPPAAQDPVYAEQCGACHLAYPPSLMPAAAWSGILDHLGHHFGEDASLDAPTIAHLRAYLAANSAEHWDTLPAVRLRSSIDPADPMRITATRFWRNMHRRIPAATFASPKVSSRASCEACHRDAATGRFAPQKIEIPEASE
ncbi:MAG: cytochrome b/b6 domain-containing protein [Rhodospirillales bacterium]|nr:cytochrome b/b6 domain-containing protein [Rhodospirillales bacterium]